MAWYNGGNWENLDAEEHSAYIMADICNAVNERITRAGYYTVGTYAPVTWKPLDNEAPVAANFDNQKFEGSAINVNVAQARTKIESLADYYYFNQVHPLHVPDYATAITYNDWQPLSYPTFADFLDTLGYGSSWVTSRVQSFEMWEQMRLALNAITLTHQHVTYGSPTKVLFYNGGTRGTTSKPTEQQAWDELIANPLAVAAGAAVRCGYYVSTPGGNWLFSKFVANSGVTWDVAAWEYGPGLVPSRQFIIHTVLTRTGSTVAVTFDLSPGGAWVSTTGAGIRYWPGYEGANTWAVGNNVQQASIPDTATPATITKVEYIEPGASRFLVDLSPAFTYV